MTFDTAETAWLWAMERVGTHCQCKTFKAIVTVAEQLFEDGDIDYDHAYALSFWGERGTTPCYFSPSQREDFLLWNYALSHMFWPLWLRGIVIAPAISG
jgi:hypothetical protein